MTEPDFSQFAKPLIGMKLTHLWRGYGSAVFLNFGELHHHIWPDGRISNNPTGQMSLSITWSWRIEGKRRIWIGSWSEDRLWEPIFDKMIGATVLDVKLFGRLPEIDLTLSCGLHVVSFMTSNGDPEWALHEESVEQNRSISVAAGQLKMQHSEARQRVRAEDVCMLCQRREEQKRVLRNDHR